MSKRKLPRVIVAGGAAGELEHAATARGLSENNQLAGTAMPENRSNVIDIASKKELVPPSAEVNAAPTPPRTNRHTSRRRAEALAIVNHHATFSALGGLIPLPFFNFASVTALVVHMVKSLSSHYGVPFERDRARAIVVGLVGGAMPSGLASVTTSTLVYLIPASAVVGLAVSSAAAAACTRAIGQVFVDHFESGATLADMPAAPSS
jgi:uncharacterized protein (DUF697 family)